MANYWQRILPDAGALKAYELLLEAAAVFRAAQQPSRAVALELIVRELQADFVRLSERTSARADAAIREVLKAKQVRPDAPGRHLADRIHSRPLASGIATGEVGIADVEQLNQAINPRSGGRYWRAQEYGTGGGEVPSQIGRGPVPGYFQPGDSRPSADEFRVHPYFQRQSSSGVPALLIKKEIEAKHFLRDGTAAALAFHREEKSRLEQKAIAALARA